MSQEKACNSAKNVCPGSRNRPRFAYKVHFHWFHVLRCIWFINLTYPARIRWNEKSGSMARF